MSLPAGCRLGATAAIRAKRPEMYRWRRISRTDAQRTTTSNVPNSITR
nr:hypothetical protein [Escherichia coli]